jgi:hypothetical protein
MSGALELVWHYPSRRSVVLLGIHNDSPAGECRAGPGQGSVGAEGWRQHSERANGSVVGVPGIRTSRENAVRNILVKVR